MLGLFLTIDTVMASIVFFCGYYMRFRAPEDENMKYGFRTSESLKSREAWKYANRICGLNCMVVGALELFPAIPIALMMYLWMGRSIATILLFAYLELFTIILCISVTSVAKSISDKFDENGLPKEKE